MQLSLSVEDTNRLRQKLGLKLITDGPEKEVPEPESKTANLQARLTAFNKTLEANKGEKRSDESDGEKTLGQSGMSTESWLMKMGQRKVFEPESQKENSPKDNLLLEHDDIRQTSIRAKPSSLPELRLPHDIDSGLITRSGNSSKIPAHEDPVNAPSEASIVEKTAIQPQSRAIFKPKRLKPNAKTRKKNTPLLTGLAKRSKDEEDEELRRILSQSLKNQHKKENPSSQIDPSPTSHIFAAEPDPDGLTIDTTQSQLGAIARKDQTLPTITTHKEESTSAEEATVERLSEGTEEDPNTEFASTHLGGVADILRRISAPDEGPKEEFTRASKDWARRLAQKREARKKELAEIEQLYKDLPLNERTEAIELHQRKIAQEQIQDANEFNEHYQPDIKVEYLDDSGRQVDGRQAFKQLSKAFHESQAKRNQIQAKRYRTKN